MSPSILLTVVRDLMIKSVGERSRALPVLIPVHNVNGPDSLTVVVGETWIGKGNAAFQCCVDSHSAEMAMLADEHALVLFDGEYCEVVDLGSASGTLLNGEQLTPNEIVGLKEGDTLVFGHAMFNYRLSLSALSQEKPLSKAGDITPSPVESVPASWQFFPSAGRPDNLQAATLQTALDGDAVCRAIAESKDTPGDDQNLVDKNPQSEASGFAQHDSSTKESEPSSDRETTAEPDSDTAAGETRQRPASTIDESRLFSSSIDSLGRVLDSKSIALPMYGDPLMDAATLVGAVDDIKISRPAESERSQLVSDPIESIARASHIRFRHVILADDWWNSDCGAMLGYLEEGHRPVVLLPTSSGSYDFFNPADGERTEISYDTAARLELRAVRFYRRLPDVVASVWSLPRWSLRGRMSLSLIHI